MKPWQLLQDEGNRLMLELDCVCSAKINQSSCGFLIFLEHIVLYGHSATLKY